MSEVALLDPRDSRCIAEVADLAMTVLSETAERAALTDPYTGSWLKDCIAAGTYTKEGFCDNASDAVTFAAQQLGFAASREYLVGGHYITSFADPSENFSENDIIACLTWGQFSSAPAHNTLEPYIGPRHEIRRRILPDQYAKNYGASSVLVSQRFYRLLETSETGRDWLVTAAPQQCSGTITYGQIESTEPVVGCWESNLVSPLVVIRDTNDLRQVLRESRASAHLDANGVR